MLLPNHRNSGVCDVVQLIFLYCAESVVNATANKAREGRGRKLDILTNTTVNWVRIRVLTYAVFKYVQGTRVTSYLEFKRSTYVGLTT